MYINHDDVVKLATIDKAAKEALPRNPRNDFLAEVDTEISMLHTEVSSVAIFELNIRITFINL